MSEPHEQETIQHQKAAPPPPPPSEEKGMDTKRIELWIAIIGGVVTIAAALITILPQVLPDKSSQTEQVGVKLNDDPSPEPLVLAEGVDQSEASAIKDEVAAVLDQAYNLKVESLRNVDETGLDQVYTADALDYRLSTVQLARDSNCYWNITLDQPHEYDFEYISANSARVSTIRVESRFHYCDGKLVTKDTFSGDRYFVRFYLLNNDGQWQIYDTDVNDLPDD